MRKKLITLLAMFLLVFTFNACRGGGSSSNGGSITPSGGNNDITDPGIPGDEINGEDEDELGPYLFVDLYSDGFIASHALDWDATITDYDGDVLIAVNLGELLDDAKNNGNGYKTLSASAFFELYTNNAAFRQAFQDAFLLNVLDALGMNDTPDNRDKVRVYINQAVNLWGTGQTSQGDKGIMLFGEDDQGNELPVLYIGYAPNYFGDALNPGAYFMILSILDENDNLVFVVTWDGAETWTGVVQAGLSNIYDAAGDPDEGF